MSMVSLCKGDVSTVLALIWMVTPSQTIVAEVDELRTMLWMGPSMERGAMAAAALPATKLPNPMRAALTTCRREFRDAKGEMDMAGSLLLGVDPGAWKNPLPARICTRGEEGSLPESYQARSAPIKNITFISDAYSNLCIRKNYRR
jgi:hypothetical protein